MKPYNFRQTMTLNGYRKRTDISVQRREAAENDLPRIDIRLWIESVNTRNQRGEFISSQLSLIESEARSFARALYPELTHVASGLQACSLAVSEACALLDIAQQVEGQCEAATQALRILAAAHAQARLILDGQTPGTANPPALGEA